MKSDVVSAKDGLKRCAEAFERLRLGCPNIEAHIGLPASKVTAGIVSVEAGFDRGYLKKARASHAPLIGLIEAFRKAHSTDAQSTQAQVRRAKEKVDRASGELEEMKSLFHQVLTQNIQLVERIRTLEEQIKKKNVAPIRR